MNKCHFEIKENAQAPIEGGDVLLVNIGANMDTTSLAIIVDDTNAHAWADLFKKEVKQSALSSQKHLPDVISEATKKIGENTKDLPMPAFLVSRISNGIFEAFANGDCGLVVHYQDGVVESYAANKSKETDLSSSRVSRISKDRRRNLSTYTNGSMWSLAARVEAVQSVALLPAVDENEAQPVHKISSSKRRALLLDLVDEREYD